MTRPESSALPLPDSRQTEHLAPRLDASIPSKIAGIDSTKPDLSSL